MAIEVIYPGFLTTIQDLGRFGYQKLGIPVSGAMDTAAYEAANRLCGNVNGEAVLEMTMLGGRYVFHDPAVIAITGADMHPTVNGMDVPMYTQLHVQAGDRLDLHSVDNGCRTYLAVAGGLDIPAVMGSRSTHIRCRIGGVEGRALKRGDIIPTGTKDPSELPSAKQLAQPVYEKEITVRVIPGPQDDCFTEKGRETFYSSSYIVTQQSDRMGVRLKGAQIESKEGTDIVSDGIVFGSIQVTGAGLPIVLMADRQTTGGYAKIATVVSEDLPLLAQAAPDTIVHFKEYKEVKGRSMYKVDLNSDMGESFGNYTCGMDEEVLKYITSANVACGFHASDPMVMAKTVEMAKKQGVHVGAHPGFPDLQGFGRRRMTMSYDEIRTMIIYQIGALDAFCKASGVTLQHVKPHGALYNMADKDMKMAEAIARGIADVNPELILLAPAGSCMTKAAEQIGLPVAYEVFADRAYEEDGSLVARSKPGAMITDQQEAVQRVLQMIKEGTVTAITGKKIPVKADSICIHGDSPAALQFSKAIHDALLEEGIELAPLK